jgi:hypothetical protein
VALISKPASAVSVLRAPDGQRHETRTQVRAPLAPALALLFAAAVPVRAAVPGDAAQDAAREVVARCAASAAAQHAGLTKLEEDCPGLGAALTQLRVKDSLAEGVAEQIDARALRELLAATRTAARPGPDPSQVGPVLAGLEVRPQTESRWQRFRTWLRRMLTPGRRGSTPWLAEWLEQLTPGKLLRDVLLWSLMGAIVVAAVVVVARELRVSGLHWARPLRRRNPQPMSDAVAAPVEGVGTWRQFDVTQRPAALFRHVAALLAAAGRLPAPRGYTHRELRQRAQLDAPAERAAWNALARVAERQIYAPRDQPDAAAGQAVADAARIWDPETQ